MKPSSNRPQNASGNTGNCGVGCIVLIIVALILVVASFTIPSVSSSSVLEGLTTTPTLSVQVHTIQNMAATPTLSRSTTHPMSSPTATPTPRPKPTPTPKPTPKPKPTPTPLPKPTPVPTSPPCSGINCNPWGYTLTPGNLIYYPSATFCSYFPCIKSFWERDDPGDGYVVVCNDGLYSQSGGERGACSYHGGVSQPVYSH